MSTTKSAHNTVPMGAKIAFGLGMLANQMFPAALGIFMVVLVKDLGFEGWQWSLIYFLPRIFDSFTDPIMGFISDNTKSKWGRRRQYVMIGALVMGVSFVIMWQLYRESGIDYNFTYFMLWSFAFYLGLTIFSVPYVAIGYEMSEDFHERTQIMAIAQWIGQWAWVIAPWFWVVMYDPDWFPSADAATRELAIWVGIACMLLAMVPAIFIKSKSTINEDYAPLTLKNIGGSLNEIFDGFKEAFQSVPFRRLCVATFFIYNSFMTVSAFSFFIVVYHLFNGDAAGAGIWPTLFGSLGALITTFAVIPTVAWMSKKMEKKQAFLLSQGISIFGYIMLWFLFVPGKPYMFIFALPFFSFGIGSLFTLMMSMTADVIDLDELNTGKRREGIFGAIYWWMVKFGFAIAGGLSGLILTFVGFDSTPGAVQAPEAITGLRLFFSGVPVLGTILAIVVMWNYKISEERSKEIRAELDKRKKPKASSGYGSWIHTELFNGIALPSLPLSDFNAKTEAELRSALADRLKTGLHGLCFSPYIEGQDAGDILTENQIAKRMDIVARHTEWVRSFSVTKGNEFIPKVAKEKGLKTMVGAWISEDKARNEKEIANLISLCNQGLVDIAVVGNEVLLREELLPQDIIGYLKMVKLQVDNVPVGYVDTYYHLYQNKEIMEQSDVILVNCYPFWEGSSIGNALTDLRKMYHLIKDTAGAKEVIISETGWPSKGSNVDASEPSHVNAMNYFVATQEWAEKAQVKTFHFSSFDESWKVRDEGELGARWGLWDVNEKLKYS